MRAYFWIRVGVVCHVVGGSAWRYRRGLLVRRSLRDQPGFRRQEQDLAHGAAKDVLSRVVCCRGEKKWFERIEEDDDGRNGGLVCYISYTSLPIYPLAGRLSLQ